MWKETHALSGHEVVFARGSRGRHNPGLFGSMAASDENQPLKGNVLIVLAHEEPKSFNAAMKDAAVETLRREGFSVQVSDLYAQRFNPVLSRRDLNLEKDDAEHINYSTEIGKACAAGKLSADVLDEMGKVVRADLVIFQFPLYWLSMPSLLKGWLERVMVNEFAFNKSGKIFEFSPLAGKRCLLSITTGAPSTFFSDHGVLGDMDIILWSMKVSLRFCGFDVLRPQIVHGMDTVSTERLTQELEDWKKRLPTIFEEEPMKFLPLHNFDPDNGMILKSEFVESEQDNKHGPTVGQHLRKILPKAFPK